MITLRSPARWAAVVLAVVILGPLAWPGYVLSYDMVFVPRQRLSWSLLAPADALPRAVPLDAAVALLNLAVPGWLLQRVALAGIVCAAAVGAGRLVPTRRVLPRIVAAVGYVWTAYLAERLLLGQWALLSCYAALPWLVAASIDVRRGMRGGLPRLVLAAAAASITPTGGLIATVCVAALVPGRRKVGGRAPSRVARVASGGRTDWWALAAVASLNAPWLVASVVSSAGGRSDPAGVAAFAARAENWSGTVGALLGTGGVWNRLTTPDSRSWMVAPLITLFLLVLGAAGWSRLRAGLPAGVAARLAGLAGGGLLVAVAGATPPGAAVLRFLVVQVPGAGLLRDGQKFLIPYALLLTLCVACGTDRLADRLGAESGGVLAVAAVVLPVLAMPDLAWGGGGALRPVPYPADWAVVSRTVAAAPGDVLALPFAAYRRYAWNHGRAVIDPLPRYLAVAVVADDTLVVGGVAIAGEDRRAASVQSHLAAGGAAADLGVAWVVVEGPGVAPSTLAGLERVYSGPTLSLYRNPSPPPVAPAPAGRRIAMLTSYAVALGIVLVAAACLMRIRSQDLKRRRLRRLRRHGGVEPGVGHAPAP